MKVNHKVVLATVLVGVVLNLVLPKVLRMVASENQIDPPNSVLELSLWDRVVFMLVRYREPVASSITIGLVVGVCCYLGHMLAHHL